MAITSKIVRPSLNVKGREVTVASPLALPAGVNGFVFRVKRPTKEDDRGQFADKDVDTLFQVWKSKDGSEWTKGWAYADTGGSVVVNDHPWTPRIWKRGEVCNDLTTRYRALEDTDQPPTNENYWLRLGAWVPKEADYSFIDFGVKEDGLIYMVTATHDGEKAQSIEPELVYSIGPRPQYLLRNSVGFVDSEIAGTTGNTITSPGLTVTGSNPLFASFCGTYGGSVSVTKLNNGSGADFTAINSTANAYNGADNRCLAGPSDNDAVYITFTGGPYKFSRIISVNNADQSVQPLSSGLWATNGTWNGGSKTFSNNIPAASGAMVFGGVIFTDLDYTALGNPTVGSGQNAIGAATALANSHACVASYETASSTSESTSFTLVETGPGSQTIYYSIAAWTIKEAGGGGPQEYDRTLSESISVTDNIRRFTERFRLLGETIAVADSIASSIVGAPIVRTLSDDASVSDALSSVSEDYRTLSDNASVTDTLTVDYFAASYLSTISDGINVADNIVKEQVLTRVLRENIAIVDTVERFGIGPSGSCSFDCAVGTTKLAMRNMGWTGGTSTSGFKFQFSYNVNGGSFSDWADIDNPNVSDVDWYVNGAGWPFEFDDDGEDFTPGDVVGVVMRAVDDSGDGDATSIQYYKIHDTWHRPAVRRYKPNSSTGHAAGMWDVVGTNPISGPLTNGGNDGIIFGGLGMAYGTDDPDTPYHTLSYDGNNVPTIWEHAVWDESREENGGAGGTFGYLLPLEGVVSSGQKTATLTWTNPTMERSPALVVAIYQYVHQSSPLAALRQRIRPQPVEALSTGNIPGVSDIDYDAVTEALLDGGANYRHFHCLDIPASNDEGVLSFFEGYGQLHHGSTGINTSFGENPFGNVWTGGSTSSPAQTSVIVPIDDSENVLTDFVVYAGAGVGAEDCCRLAVYDNGTIPITPLHKQRWGWCNLGGHDWGSINAVILRPSPDLISSNAVLSAGVASISVRDVMLVNHGSVLHAVYTQGDTAPTAQEIQDEIDNPGSSGYSGTFHLASERVIVSGDSLAVTGGNLDTTLSGLSLGNYALASVYQSQQAFKGGTADLGEVLTQNFDITQVVYDVTLNESLSVSDIDHRWATLHRTTPDTMTLVDIAIESLIRERYMQEAVTVTELLAREFLYTRLLRDDAEVIDSLSAEFAGLIERLLIDAATVTDATAGIAQYSRLLTETQVNVTEVTVAARELYRAMQEAVATTGDALQVDAKLVHALQDAITNVTDDLVKEQILERVLTEQVDVEDGMNVVIGVILGAVIRGIVFKLNDLQRPDFFRLTDEE